MSENITSPIASARTQPTLLESIVSAKGEAANERRAKRAEKPLTSRYGSATVLGFVELADDSDDAFVSAVEDAWAENIEAEKAIVSDDNIEAAWAAADNVRDDGLIEIVDMT